MLGAKEEEKGRKAFMGDDVFFAECRISQARNIGLFEYSRIV